jgi:DMSO/TMAO reductase YedYZ molybdopterin-dependent catalytic subunit
VKKLTVHLPVGPLVGGLIALVATLLLRSLTGTRLLAEVVVDASTFGLQPEGFSFLLKVFGALGKTLLFTSVLLAQVALFVAAWRWPRRQAIPVLKQAVIAAAIVAAVVLVLTAALVALTPAGLGSHTAWPQYVAVTLFASAVYAAVTLTLETLPQAAPVGVDSPAGPGRRRFIAAVPLLLLGGAVIIIGRQIVKTAGGGVQAARAPGPTPEITANKDFYIVSKNLIDPAVDGNAWRLRVGGAVKTMLDLKYVDVLAMPAVEQYTTLQCISNEVGGDLMSSALWKGVPLRMVLDLAGVQPSAAFVSFRSNDDYSDTIPLDFARQDGVVLAYEMNGERLPDKHGFPLRMLSPGKYGMKHPKWITEIALLDKETLGYWQQRGWDQTARMNTSTRIDTPRDGDDISGSVYRINGIAFAGNRGISRVEVSTDGGKEWQDAALKPALSPYAWALWYYDWTNVPQSGRAAIVARATDGTGDPQIPNEAPPYPSGATGYPRVTVSFKPMA